MNVTLRLKDAALESKFVKEAAERGLIELSGHRFQLETQLEDRWEESECHFIMPFPLKQWIHSFNLWNSSNQQLNILLDTYKFIGFNRNCCLIQFWLLR